MCFVGLSIHALANKENPLCEYGDLVHSVRCCTLITKSWQDL